MKDKFKHFFIGFLFAFLIAVPVHVACHNIFAGLWACLAGVVAGGVYEWCSMHTDGNKWCWKDFCVTAVGTGIVMLLILISHFGNG